MMSSNRKTVIKLLVLVALILITLGTSIAFIDYVKEGNAETIIEVGKINFEYNGKENSGNSIIIAEAEPISDELGKRQTGAGKTFDFKVTSNTETSSVIPYKVTVRKKSNSTLNEEEVKLYLTKVNDSTEEEVLLSKYSDLNSTNNINNERAEKTIYTGVVPANEEDFEQAFRLRMWVDEDANFEETSEKTFTVMVNMYADEEMSTEEEILALDNLEIVGQTLTPGFNPSTTIYILTVPYSVKDLEVIPTINNNDLSYEITGDKDLVVGENIVSIVVKGKSEKTKTYTIAVTREKDTDNTLKTLNLTNCNLSPKFTSEINTYSCTVENNITSTTISAESTSSVATVIGTGKTKLNIGKNKVSLKVIAQNGEEKIYTVEVTRKLNSDSTLKALSVTGYEISPEFKSNKTDYSLTVPNTVTNVEVNATKNNSKSSFKILKNDSLVVGDNLIKVVVTAEDKSTKTYTITVTREKDPINTLSSLNLTNCTMSPDFSTDVTNYSCIVENSVTSTIVSATPTSSVATIEGTGERNLVVGKNAITVDVTSQSGNKKLYTVEVTRKANSNATLKSLNVTDQIISPDFDPNNPNYLLTVPYSATNIEVNAITAHDQATVEVFGNNNLVIGENIVTIKVTAEDKTVMTYTITVTREKDTVDTLSNLTLTDCTLDPEFSSDITEYRCTVENDITSTTVNSIATSSVAIISGTTQNDLIEGENQIEITVTSQSGSIKVYKVIVNRKKLIETVSIFGKDYSVIDAIPNLTIQDYYDFESGLYKSIDTNDNKPTYYFRGANVSNNYVKFAGYTWRILRINEDGSIRLVFDDPVYPKENLYGYFNPLTYNNENMYYSNSNIEDGVMYKLEKWYTENIIDKGFVDKISPANNYFCEQIKNSNNNNNEAENVDVTTKTQESYVANFKCETDSNNKGIINTNIGLITYDEAIHIGANIKNTWFNNETMTMTPAGEGKYWYISNGMAYDLHNYQHFYAPVINLKADLTVIGEGTVDSPFEIQ